MIVTLARDADPARVQAALVAAGLWVERLADDDGRVSFATLPHSATVDRRALLAIDGVAAVAAPASAHPRIDAQGPVVRVGDVAVGGGAPVLMAGPCSVESERHVLEAAARLAPLGVRFLRGGAYKPRTSPYAFQGVGAPGLEWLRRAADAHGLKVVTELLAPEDAEPVAAHADLVQIGSRHMHATPLLRAAGRTGRPVLLKRGMAATIEEWLCAAETCLLAGASGVILCERGIRGFDPETRNVLDLGAVALLAHARRLPVVVDPSHAAGRRDLIPALGRAAIAAGAAGLLVETHDDPGRALSDGPQALSHETLAALAAELRRSHA